MLRLLRGAAGGDSSTSRAAGLSGLDRLFSAGLSVFGVSTLSPFSKRLGAEGFRPTGLD